MPPSIPVWQEILCPLLTGILTWRLPISFACQGFFLQDLKTMNKTIGLLLPRSSEYPSMGFDILAGLKAGLAKHSGEEFRFVTENIGFGENPVHNYACAEKMILQEDAAAILCYSHFLNAEPLYALASSSGKPFIFMDAGMQMMTVPQHERCFHISLQECMPVQWQAQACCGRQ